MTMVEMVYVDGLTDSLPGTFGLPGNMITASAIFGAVTSGDIISQIATMIAFATNPVQGVASSTTY